MNVQEKSAGEHTNVHVGGMDTINEEVIWVSRRRDILNEVGTCSKR